MRIGNRSWKKQATAGAVLGLLGMLTAPAALAQDEPVAPYAIPPEQYSVSPAGVDMRTGQYTYSNTDLTIGGDAGLAFVRNNGTNEPRAKKPFGNFAHNWDAYIVEAPAWPVGGDPTWSFTVSVYAGGRSDSFTSAHPTLGQTINRTTTTASPARLKITGLANDDRDFEYRAADGTIVNFRSLLDQDCFQARGRCAYASSITQPDGVRYDFQYDNPNSGQVNGARLRRVTSNFGYALILEYFAYADSNNLVKKACLINLAEEVAPASNICPSAALTATYTYSANGHLASYTDPLGNVHDFTSGYNSSAALPHEYDVEFYRPGDASPYLTNRMERRPFFIEVVKKQTFTDGRTFDYWWNEIPHSEFSREVAGGDYTKNDGSLVKVRFKEYPQPGDLGRRVSPGPWRITDELGRALEADYCLPHPLNTSMCLVTQVQSWTFPEGNKREFDYDPNGNIIETRLVAKPGSGLANIVTTADYDCLNLILCNKPVYTIDGEGNRTDFTYDGTHGGMLTSTGPADPAGIRPQTRYEYQQRYAWIKKSSGGYEKMAHPVWLRVKERFCRTTAASGASCAGGSADEVVTEFDYGPDSGPNNLVLRGQTVTADGVTLRTCYGYDDQGRQISQTAPRADLSSCP